MGKMIHARRWAVLVIMLLLCAPALTSIVMGNTGMLALRDGLMAQADFVPGDYPFYAALDAGERTEQIAQTLRHAVDLNPGSPSLRWALGRVALAADDAKAAAGALEPLVEKGTHQPLLYSDALLAFSQGGRLEAATALYELAPLLQQRQTISDAVALAYLEQGCQGALERAIALRPGDLYANYFLWKQAQEAGDMEATATYSETLTYFPLGAIDPTDERLLDYAAEVIPNLLEDGLWNREKTLNVVSFLVWQHHESPGVERLLEQLIERYPTETDWSFYLAELYHRRGDLEQAAGTYRQVLTVDPAYAQAYLRLGMVAEANCKLRIANCEGMEEAAGWYEQYRELAPDDLLGLKKLTEVCEVLGRPGTVALREVLEARTDDRRIVAELLDVLVEDVELGPNLVANGGFEEWEDTNPVGWRLGTYLGQSRDAGLYVAGKDMLVAGEEVARIATLWGGAMPDGTMTYAEYVGEDIPIADTKYLVSLCYRSWGFTEGSGLVFWGEYTRSDGLVLLHEPLPPSNGQWKKFRVLVDGPAVLISVIPLVRNWGVGQLCIQAIEIRPVTYIEGP